MPMRGFREKLNDAKSKLLRRNSRESATGSWGRQSRHSLSRDGHDSSERGSSSKLSQNCSDSRLDITSQGLNGTSPCLSNDPGIPVQENESERSDREYAVESPSVVGSLPLQSPKAPSISFVDTKREKETTGHGADGGNLVVEVEGRSVDSASGPPKEAHIGREKPQDSKHTAAPAITTTTTTALVPEIDTTVTVTDNTISKTTNEDNKNNNNNGHNNHNNHNNSKINHSKDQLEQRAETPSPTSTTTANPAATIAITSTTTKNTTNNNHHNNNTNNRSSNIEQQSQNLASNSDFSKTLSDTHDAAAISSSVEFIPTNSGIEVEAGRQEFNHAVRPVKVENSTTRGETPLTGVGISPARAINSITRDDYSLDQSTATRRLEPSNTNSNKNIRTPFEQPSSLSIPRHTPALKSGNDSLPRKGSLTDSEHTTGSFETSETFHNSPRGSVSSPQDTGDPHKAEFSRNISAGQTIAARKASLKEQVLSLRRQSLLPQSDAVLINSLLQNDGSPIIAQNGVLAQSLPPTIPGSPPSTAMTARKIWVKRPVGSPTQIVIVEDDLVDAVRDMCLRKYSNALGRQYDAPDLTVKICPPVKSLRGASRHHSVSYGLPERLLAPDEVVAKLLDEYYPGGQTAEDALIVDVPPPPARRTPRPSPGHAISYAYGTVPSVHDLGIGDAVGEYFPPMANLPPSAHSQSSSTAAIAQIPNAMSIVATSPPIPGSPGRRSASHGRPAMNRRLHTASPTTATATSAIPNGTMGVMLMPKTQNRPRGSAENSTVNTPAVAPPAKKATSPAHVEPPRKTDTPVPPARVASPRPAKKEKAPSPTGLLDGAVPPINVLIVEDNIINLKLLEAFMKRLKVRWQTAMNGKEAVNKWRVGGFHLVLMDIQLPVMNGLEATKEIRRLERVNSIGSFSSAPNAPQSSEPLADEDKLATSSLFKSPVIIVALTASSLQSDRHEALAAGCNDFLTKPVNFIFLERKVTEWGCMQALIDFDGWKSWVGVR